MNIFQKRQTDGVRAEKPAATEQKETELKRTEFHFSSIEAAMIQRDAMTALRHGK